MKHTDGPWTHDKEDMGYSIGNAKTGRVKGNHDYTVCTINGNSFQDEANARLIAAAPELLDALSNLLNWGRDHLSPVHEPETLPLLIAAHNAIAKATETK